MFTELIAKYIASEHLLSAKDKVIVGVSGGADSVALLCVLLDLGYSCEAIHCNFHLRGDEADRDEAFVRSLCEKKGVKLHVVHFQTAEYAAQHKISIEMAARELRYDFFEQKRQELQAAVIAVAHHRDDSVETFLLNLMRGTGINGLKGIRPKNGWVVRPLLCVSREDILRYLDAIHESYVTDSTNLHDDYKRNKVRLNLLPLMETINPSVRESIALAASRLSDVALIYDKVMEEKIKQVTCTQSGGVLRVDIAACMSSEAPRALLYELFSPYGFNASQLDDIYASAESEPGRRFLSATHEVIRDRECWLLCPLAGGRKDESVIRLEEMEGELQLPHGAGMITWQKVKRTAGFVIPRDRNTVCADASCLIFPLLLRHVMPGDKFIPFGMRGKKKLSDYMTDRKFSLFQKENQWVLCSGDKIIWLVGERADERFRVNDSTDEILLVKLVR